MIEFRACRLAASPISKNRGHDAAMRRHPSSPTGQLGGPRRLRSPARAWLLGCTWCGFRPRAAVARQFGRVSGPAPQLGADTDAVLRDVLALSTGEIAALREAGALG